MRHHVNRLGLLAAVTALAGACADTNTSPTAPVVGRSEVANSAVKFWEAGATAAWNQTARELIAARPATSTGPTVQLRILTYLTLAQYNAVVMAEDTKDHGSQASPAAAVGGASVVVLKSFFPDPADQTLIDARLAEQLAATPWPGEKQNDAASGEAAGRAVGAAVVAYAASDNFNQLPLPPMPVGEAYWYSNTSPPTASFRALWGTRPFFLTSADQFRPADPPAFGSPAFLTDLAEIRTLSDTRTAEQLAIAQKWAPRAALYMNEVAAGMIVSHRVSEREAAHILALANMAAFDAHIGCWDAKFAYWFVRPYQADLAITTPIGKPNHPSYISGHSCNTASYAAVLAHAFPTETALLEGYVIEAGLSRMYGGIHYRFDITAGQQLGREVAAWAIAHDVVGHEPFPLD
jgi:membrane-associated phospholipid phosphatase